MGRQQAPVFFMWGQRVFRQAGVDQFFHRLGPEVVPSIVGSDGCVLRGIEAQILERQLHDLTAVDEGGVDELGQRHGRLETGFAEVAVGG